MAGAEEILVGGAGAPKTFLEVAIFVTMHPLATPAKPSPLVHGLMEITFLTGGGT